MNTERLTQLLKFLEEDPHDAFTLYAVATEYRVSDPDQALVYFEKLLTEHPHYVATYYHAAELYLDRDERDRAEQVYRIGIQQATAQNEALLLRELQNAYNAFLLDE